MKARSKRTSRSTYPLSRDEALRMIEASYLAAATALLWIGLYYLPFGGAIFRLALPLPLALLQVRRGFRSGLNGVVLALSLLIVLMGPVRGPLILFPYGILAIWLGWTWRKGFSWWLSWFGGAFIGTSGFIVRVIVLSILVGENLWVVITRAGSNLLERLVELFNLPLSGDLFQVQLMAICLIIVQELVYVMALHLIAFWIFPRFKALLPDPPSLLHGLASFD